MVRFQPSSMWKAPIAMAAVLAAVLGGSVARSQVIDISGSAISPNTLIDSAGGTSGRFIADSTTAWNADWGRPLDINGFTVMSQSGNNSRTFSSVISGTGIVASNNNRITISGTASNTFTGTYRPGGLWILNKTAGLDAINGTLQLTWISGADPFNTFGQPVVRWDRNDNVNDATQVIFGSASDAGSSGLLNFNNRSDMLGDVALLAYGLIDMGANSTASVSFADSSANAWTNDKFIKVLNYTTTSTIGFGGLTSSQLGQIYFRNPTGFAEGTYTAKFASGTSGAIVPDQSVVNPTVPIAGSYSSPSAQIGDQQDARLTADATFVEAVTNINVDVNGFTLTSTTGGNARSLNGQISGASGTLSLPQRSLTIGGTAANTFAGTTIVSAAVSNFTQVGTALAKPDGQDAIAGPLRIDCGTANHFTIVRLNNSNQINDASVVTFNPTNATATSILRMNGRSDTIGGSGSLTAALTVAGTVAPGESIESLATGSVDFLSGSTFAYELDSSLVTGDLLASSGSLSIASGTNLSVLDLGPAILPTDGSAKLTLISYTGTWDEGVFDYQSSPLCPIVAGTAGSLVFDVTSGNAILSKPTAASTACGDTISANVTLNANLDITNAALSSPLTISGNFSDDTPSRAINKLGGGRLVLSGANTYTGGSTLTAGTLQFNSAAAIAGSGRNVTVSAGA